MKKINLKREVISTVAMMGIAQKAITDQSDFIKDLGLDSLDISELMMEFELKFNIEIPYTDAEKIKTVRQAINYLNQHI